MHRSPRLAALAALALAMSLAAAPASAVAAEGGKPPGQTVDLSPVALPIIVNGRLMNYVFVYVRIDLTPTADTPHWRDKEPYFREALVRLGYHTPFVVPGDYTKLDEPRLKAAIYQAAVAITGPGTVTGVEIMPGGGPMRRSGFPKPPAG